MIDCTLGDALDVRRARLVIGRGAFDDRASQGAEHQELRLAGRACQ
jgi:hypothetical protein